MWSVAPLHLLLVLNSGSLALVLHENGALVPEFTPEVAAARSLHLQAHTAAAAENQELVDEKEIDEEQKLADEQELVDEKEIVEEQKLADELVDEQEQFDEQQLVDSVVE